MFDSPLSQRSYMIVAWTLCATAIVIVICRVATCLHIHKKIQLDDYLLSFASICVLTATVLAQTQQDYFFEIGHLMMEPDPDMPPMQMDETMTILYHGTMFSFGFTALMWTAIYSAKFAYLSFFKRLIRGMKVMVWYWRIVYVLTALSWILAFTYNFSVCPWTDMRLVQCTYGARFMSMFGLFTAATSLDVLTDILIFLIPVIVLRKVQLKRSQKFGIGLFLCLSIALVPLAITRISRFRSRSVYGMVTLNDVWAFFWLQIEGCLAVCFVSLTAFRSLFIAHERKRQEEKAKKARFSDFIRRITPSSWNSALRSRNLPSIPRGDITGLRSFFENNDFTGTTLDNEKEESGEGSSGSQIMVTKTFATNVEEIRVLGRSQPSYTSSTTHNSI